MIDTSIIQIEFKVNKFDVLPSGWDLLPLSRSSLVTSQSDRPEPCETMDGNSGPGWHRPCTEPLTGITKLFL